jgi:tRNA-specific 2-thiouridylase
LFVKDLHFLASKDFNFPLKANCKIRYRQADQDCIIYKEGNKYKVEFKEPQRAIASGQICAIYLVDELIMS